MDFPSLSVVVPTLNSESTLERCLLALFQQEYPLENMELIIVDAYSEDDTVNVALRFGAKILYNPLITGEAGKAVGIEASNKEFILSLDSDNIIPSKDWLARMFEPLQANKEIVASEPLYYGYQRSHPTLIRYCSLIGADDPISVYLGFYGRFSFLKGRWTDLPIDFEDRLNYFEVKLNPDVVIPTMGANGFIVKASAIKKTNYKPYLFDVDIIYDLVRLGYDKFARVKTSMTHLFAYNFSQYIRKTYRRVRDFYHYHKLGMRKYRWTDFNKIKLLKLTLFTIVLLPLFRDAIRGYKRKPDTAWFLNWILCALALGVYGLKELSSGFYMLRQRRRTST